MIDNGVLRFKPSRPTTKWRLMADPDDEPSDNMYMVTVQAMDSTGKTGEEMVTVEVTNVDEPGTVTLSALQPQAGTKLTATTPIATPMVTGSIHPTSSGSGPSP